MLVWSRLSKAEQEYFHATQPRTHDGVLVDDTGAESSWVTKIVMTPQYRTNGVSFCVRYDLPNFPRLYPKHSPFSLQRKIGTLISFYNPAETKLPQITYAARNYHHWAVSPLTIQAQMRPSRWLPNGCKIVVKTTETATQVTTGTPGIRRDC